METDNQLIKKVQAGDNSAFETLVCRYDRHVLNIASSFRNSEDDAKDIYQEVFLRVYKGLNNFQFRSEFATWLFRITTNVCITFDNKKKRYQIDSIDREQYTDSTETLAESIPGEQLSDQKILQSETKYKIDLQFL